MARPNEQREIEAHMLAQELIADVGYLDALDWLEDLLAECDDQHEALYLTYVISAVEAASHGRLH
ncbi:hypothetical protein SAMN05192583_2120 [Sphingomonas gellani]|uniref:Uncharacterized protein n=1 Tax=Sphingomonas gellani TaxID=1166340 RepID=A0A1H8EDI0_9SPHN|nr:hypothetical protein [Sphingomonas gellani]SEN16877.1 hypothetical protein SAMN05192583_2120 [Sphingomonas gellani]